MFELGWGAQNLSSHHVPVHGKEIRKVSLVSHGNELERQDVRKGPVRDGVKPSREKLLLDARRGLKRLPLYGTRRTKNHADGDRAA